MDFRELTYLLAIDRCRSITRAAEELYISQSGLTKFLKRLERELGFELFRWTGNYMAPTPAGREYLDFARQVLELKEALDRRVAALPQSRTALRVGVCLNTVAFYKDAIALFSRRYPNVQLTITEAFSEDIGKMLLEGDLDLIFPNGCQPNANLVEEPVRRRQVYLYLPAGLELPAPGRVPFSDRPWVDLKELRVPLVVLRASPQARYWEQGILRETGFCPSSVTFVKSLLSKIRLAKNTPAACFLLLDEDGRSPSGEFDDYRRLYAFGDRPAWDVISAVYSKKLPDPFYAREFIRLVKSARPEEEEPFP